MYIQANKTYEIIENEKKNQRHMSDTSNCYYWCFHFEIHLLALHVHLRENKLTYRQQNE